MRELGPIPGTLHIHIDADAEVLAHKPTLVQVVVNLLSNAQKFVATGALPQVEIATSRVDGFVRLSVADHGIGIALEHQQRIYQVFERLHTMEEYPGTGIGLAIVKRGIERMQGRYGLESTLGKGSTFWIDLPQVRG